MNIIACGQKLHKPQRYDLTQTFKIELYFFDERAWVVCWRSELKPNFKHYAMQLKIL